jgi:hypothetical protein
LYEQNETQASEPILFIISPGADPSQELEDLAKATIGTEKYHQVGNELNTKRLSRILLVLLLRESLIDRFWCYQDCICNYVSDLDGTGSQSPK